MARLKTLGPSLGRMLPSLNILRSTPAQQSRDRAARLDSHKWKKTARWQALRWEVLVRDMFTCGKCWRVELDTSKLVADHRQPHRGDEALFWDEANLWCLCEHCHSSVKQAEERAGQW